MNFYPGQKVVCVDDSPDIFGRPIIVVKGNVYTIRSLVEPDWWGNTGVLLDEVEPPEDAMGWSAYRFRPVTDISEFKKLLKTQPVLEDA